MKISKIRNNIIEKYFACLFGAVVRQNNNYLDTSFCSENDSNVVKIDVLIKNITIMQSRGQLIFHMKNGALYIVSQKIFAICYR